MPDAIGPKEFEELQRFNRDFVKQNKVTDYFKDPKININKDEYISSEDNIDLLSKMAKSTLPDTKADGTKLTPEEIKELKEAQQAILDNSELLKKPPLDLSKAGYKKEIIDSLSNPYKLPNAAENQFWKNERLKYKGQTLNLNPNNALRLVQEALKGNENADLKERAKAITKGLWENFDSSNKKTFRMEEILAVQQYIKTLAQEDQVKFKEEFFKEMGKYISDANNGLDAKFVFNSLLYLYQSTDWSGTGNDDLEKLIKGLAEGIASTEGFGIKEIKDFGENNGVIAGNYNGTDDGNPYGSLALFMYKEKDGAKEVIKFKWLEYKTASQLDKISYTFDNAKPSEGSPAIGGQGGAGKTKLADAQKKKLTEALNKTREKINAALNVASDAVIPIADFDSLSGVQKSLALARANLDILLSQVQAGKEIDKNMLGLLEGLIKELENAAKEIEGLDTKALKTVFNELKTRIPVIVLPTTIPMNPKVQLYLGDMFAIMRGIMAPFSTTPENQIDDISRPLWNAMKEYEQLILDGFTNPHGVDIVKLEFGARNLKDAGADDTLTDKLIYIVNDLRKTFGRNTTRRTGP